MLELLHFIELPLRDSIHTELSRVYVKRWYERDDILDTRTSRAFQKAQRELGKQLGKEPDRVIAQVSLGTWTGLFEPGGQIRDASGKYLHAADYERDLWLPALSNVFGDIARTRYEAETLLRRVRRARNRVAHHESIVFGVHQIGERQNGQLVRQSSESLLKDIRTLLLLLAPDLHDWLATCDHVENLLQSELAEAAIHYAKLKRQAFWI